MPLYRTHNNTSVLCITVDELDDCGVSIDYLKKALAWNRQGKLSCWPHHKEGRQIFIHYDGIQEQYQNMIRGIVCKGQDPYSLSLDTYLNTLLSAKAEHASYFDDYRLPDGRRLPPADKSDYIEACRWLELLVRIKDDPTFEYTRYGYNNRKSFIRAVASIIAIRKIKLPIHYRRLVDKIEIFKKAGPECVIKHNYGSTNNTKVSPDMKALIRQIYAQHNQYPAEQVARIVNHTAREHGWPEISAQTVRNHIKEVEIRSFRDGINPWRNAYDFIVRRVRPSAPNLLWVGDGTPMELFYQEVVADKNSHQLIKYCKRKMIYVITDAFNDLIVGYATGETESAALAQLAWKQACVTNGVLPHQIKVDNFAIKTMRPFYEAIALNKDWFTPAEVGNARDKTVEQTFAKLNNLVLRRFKNYSGANITAKQQPNRDYLNKIRHEFPDENGVLEQIDIAIWAWNNTIRDNGHSLYEDWISGDRLRDRVLDDAKRLNLFGTRHRYTNTLTNQGISVTIDGTTHRYMLLDTDFYLKNVGKEFQVHYDDWNLNKILITADNGTTSQVIERMEPIPMAYADIKDGDRTRLNRILDMKKQVKDRIMEYHAEDHKLLESAGIDPARAIEAEGYAKGMFPVGGEIKGMLNDANNTLMAPVPEVFTDNDLYEKIALNNSYNLQTKQEDPDE